MKAYEDKNKIPYKVSYRNNNLFIQKLNGSKNNFYNISIKKAKEILKDLGLIETTKEIESFGMGWNINKKVA